MNQIPSYAFRRRAMAAIRPVMQVLVVAALLAVLPGLISYTVTLRTQADPGLYLQEPADAIYDYMQSPSPGATADQMQAELTALLQSYVDAYELFVREKGAIYFGMVALELLLAPVMMVPLYGALLDAVRKRSVTLPASLSLLRYGPRALLLFLWMMLRVAAWMLPGMALMIVGVFLPGYAGVAVMLGGMAAVLVLGFRAAFHYVLAPIAMVDRPSLTLNGCIRESWTVMRHRKMEYFFLRVSFVGWMLLSYLITVLAISLFGSVLGMALSMMAELLLNVYVSAAIVCFYEAYVVRKETRFDPDAEAAADEQENNGTLN